VFAGPPHSMLATTHFVAYYILAHIRERRV